MTDSQVGRVAHRPVGGAATGAGMAHGGNPQRQRHGVPSSECTATATGTARDRGLNEEPVAVRRTPGDHYGGDSSGAQLFLTLKQSDRA